MRFPGVNVNGYPPMITVLQPTVMLPPCAVLSPTRAAGFPPIITVAEPLIILSGGPAQVHMLPTVAAGIPPMSTLGVPGGIIGPPVCGVGVGGGFVMGQVWLSPALAAAGITVHLID